MTRAQELLGLADRVDEEAGTNNSLDVLVEVALFEPDADYVSIRPNAAGTKIICTKPDGLEKTFWSRDFTISARQRANTAASLRALAQTRGDDRG